MRALFVALVVLSAARGVEGRECAAIEGGAPSLASVDAADRLRFLRDGLRSSARHARAWSWAWGATYAALTVGQLGLVPVVAREARPDFYVEGGASAIALLAIVVLPLRVIGDQRRLEARLASAPAGADPCALLADAERYLVRDAAAERIGKSWLLPAGVVAVNLAAGLTLALGFGRLQSAALDGAAGLAIGAIQINTQPTDSQQLLDRYRANQLGPSPPVSALQVVPLVGAGRYGLAFGGSF